MPVTITTVDPLALDLLEDLPTRPGFLRAYLLQPLDQHSAMLIAQWVSDPGGADYPASEFLDAGTEPAPEYARLTWFDVPRDPAAAEAARRAGHERIWPVVRALPSARGALVCDGTDGRQLVLSLSASLAGLQDEQEAIMSTTLLPGENPALLTGPDRLQIARVLAHVVVGTEQPVS